MERMIQLSNEDALLVKKALEKELRYETTFLVSTSQGRILLEEGDFAKRLLARDEFFLKKMSLLNDCLQEMN